MARSDLDPEKEIPSDGVSQESKPLDIETKPAEPENEATTEYPHGIRLFVIIISLMLAIFILALDNVRTRCNSKTSS